MPIAVVSTILHHDHTSNETCDDMLAITNMICIGFFFLCQPGEHSLSTDNTPFCLQDVTLYQGSDMLTYKSTGMVELDNATSVALTFTTQKNGVRGKVIRNGVTGDPYTCPVRAMVCRLQYHKQYNSPPDIPLCCYYRNKKAKFVWAKDITLALRAGVVMVKLQHNVTLNIDPREIDSRSLRSGGTTALLCTQVDRDLIQLQGRWKSDAMIHYLHVSASPWVNKFSEQMFKASNFSFLPEIHDNGAPTYDDPNPTNLPYDDPFPSGDNFHKDHSVNPPDQPSIPSPSFLPVLSPSSFSSDNDDHAHTSPSQTRPSLFLSTGLQPSDDDSDCMPSESSS